MWWSLVGRGEDLALVDEVDADLLEDLGLGKVADAGLGHDGDGDGADDLLDHGGVRHPGDSALCADLGRDAFEGHDGGGAGFFSDDGLLDVDDVHDDAALEHLGQAGFEAEGGEWGAPLGVGSGMGGLLRAVLRRFRAGGCGGSFSLAVSRGRGWWGSRRRLA